MSTDTHSKNKRRAANQDDPGWLQLIRLRLLSSSLTERFERLALGCVRKTGMDGAAISVMGDKQLIVIGGHQAARGSLAREDALFALAADQNFPVFIPDTESDPAISARISHTARPIRSLYSVPISVDGALPIGTLSCFGWERRAANLHEPLSDMDAFAEATRSIFSHRLQEEFDADTHCLTASHFADTLEREWRFAARSQREPTLLVISLPSLAAINRRHGIDEGDRLIANLAETLRRRVLVQNGVVSRITGASFAVLMHRRTSPSLLQAIAKGIRTATDVHGAQPSVAIAAISLPARRWPGYVPDGNLLLSAADRATAKRADARAEAPPIWSISDLREFSELEGPNLDSDTA